jgi:microcystin-dependent protein
MTGRIPGAMLEPASVGTPQLADNAVTPGKQSADGRLPAGSMAMFAGAAAPTGWLLCQGQAVSRTDFADLFAAIGTTWGAGDGTTTFGLPDLRGRSAIGAGTGPSLSARTLAATGGAETHQLTAGEMPSHTHFAFANASSSSATATDVNNTSQSVRELNDGTSSSNFRIKATATAATVGLTSSAGSGAAHNNMQPFAVVNYIIKT